MCTLIEFELLAYTMLVGVPGHPKNFKPHVIYPIQS